MTFYLTCSKRRAWLAMLHKPVQHSEILSAIASVNTVMETQTVAPVIAALNVRRLTYFILCAA
jgi:hypothetical protein